MMDCFCGSKDYNYPYVVQFYLMNETIMLYESGSSELIYYVTIIIDIKIRAICNKKSL